MSETLKQRLNDDIKTAMRSKEKSLLAVLRLITAAIKQREVDERIELNDEDIINVLDKMAKQRRESISQYEKAARQDLVDQEVYELDIITAYLPEQLGETEILSLITDAITTSGATEMKDMGKVMAILKPQVQGRADMGNISALIKKQLTG